MFLPLLYGGKKREKKKRKGKGTGGGSTSPPIFIDLATTVHMTFSRGKKKKRGKEKGKREVRYVFLIAASNPLKRKKKEEKEEKEGGVYGARQSLAESLPGSASLLAPEANHFFP